MSFCLWVTGLPGAGKSTIVRALHQSLEASKFRAVILNLDEMRTILTPQPRYTDEEREIVYRALVLVAKYLLEEGRRDVIIDATGNRRSFRELARTLIPDFAEVYVECPLETCIERETPRKGERVQEKLYRRALVGDLKGRLPGISSPYEAPIDPEIRIRSDLISPEEAAKRILDYIDQRWLTRQTD